MRRGGQSPARHLLRNQAIGFLLIVALCWFVELIRLPHLLFAEAPIFNWPRVLFRTGVVLAVWVWVYLSTRRLSTRLHELEEFLLMCSWCRKIGHQGTWLSTEEYFGSKFSTETSHGICPECACLHFPLESEDALFGEVAAPGNCCGSSRARAGAVSCCACETVSASGPD